MKNIITKKEKDRIDSICDQYGIENYSINSDGSIDVAGDVLLIYDELTKLPLKFNTVSGYFDCSDNDLTSLKGAPTTVGGIFNCNINQLTSLEGSPTTVGGNFHCSSNGLTSTYSGDDDIEVGSDFICHSNNLPQQLNDNLEHIKLILKYQRYFSIWNEDLTLNEENFNDLISEIEEGLL